MRPTADRRPASQWGKLELLCPGTVGRSCPHSSLPPPSSQSRGGKFWTPCIPGNLKKVGQAKRVRPKAWPLWGSAPELWACVQPSGCAHVHGGGALVHQAEQAWPNNCMNSQLFQPGGAVISGGCGGCGSVPHRLPGAPPKARRAGGRSPPP